MPWIDGDLLTPDNLNYTGIGGYRIFNVREYGATGDGSTNDAADIQEAIDAAEAAGHGIVYYPPGTYNFTTALTQTGNNILHVGAGYSSKLVSGVSSGVAFYVNDNTAGGGSITGFQMKDLWIAGGAGETTLLRCDYCLDGRMQNVKISDSTGIGFYGGRAQNFVMAGCEVRDNDSWGIDIGADAAGTQGQTFRALYNTIKDNGFTTAATGGIRLSGGSEHIVALNQIESHQDQANNKGIHCLTDRTILIGNVFEANTVNIEFGSGAVSCDGTLAAFNAAVGGEFRFTQYTNCIAAFNLLSGSWTATFGTDEGNKYTAWRYNVGTPGNITNSATAGKVIIEDLFNGATSDLQATFTSLDATPSVAGYRVFRTANGGATTITNFDDGYTGKQITIIVEDANTTIQNGTSIFTDTGADLTPSNGDLLHFVALSGTGAGNTPAWYLIRHITP